MSKCVFFGNYKGGVGKTTTVFELGAILAESHQKKVLLIDLDPQASLSKICANTTSPRISLEELNVECTLNFLIELYAEYLKNSTRLQILEFDIKSNPDYISNAVRNIKKYSKKGGKLDYIPTVLDLKNSRLNDISERLSSDTINILAFPQMLEDIITIGEYDYIFFDCPPTSNLIIQSVFLASDYYLIPTVGDEISTDGVADYITEIESTYLRFAYDENIGGMLLKMYFSDKPKLIGILETIFKTRRGRNSPADSAVLEKLDKSVSDIGLESIITGTPYVAEGRNHIFSNRIRHLDGHSPGNYGMPISLSNGEIHQEYSPIADAIAALI